MIHIDDFVIQLEGLKAYVKLRLEDFFAEESTFDETSSLSFINQQIFEKALGLDQLTEAECLLLLIALAPHCQPDFFDKIIVQKIPQAGDFPQIGGTRGKQFRGFLPTGQTAIFLLVGDDPEQQVAVRQLFSADHFFAKKNILWLEDVQEGEPQLSGRIILSQEYVELFTTGKVSKPRYSRNFPAELIETKQDWSDLVLNSETLNQIKELEIWIKHGDRLLNDLGMDRKLKPGFRALFHGPPGTGKTLTASLLGKYTGRDVFRIDLSMVVSKFIGETEKNLSKLFAKAENKNWILFFDEADALFGKRTNVKDAHDRYANQEVSYLLQRVESYNGLVILATNLKSNLDDAFIRRFQTIIHFPMPTASERLSIWQNAFPQGIKIDKQIQLEQIANQYELSGAEIMNIVQYACLQAMEFNKDIISQAILLDGIRKEFSKEGRLMN